MGLFDNLFKRRENAKALEKLRSQFGVFTAYRPRFTSWNGAVYENELVRASIDTIARHVAKLKIEFRGSANSDLINRLKKGICPFMTDSQFLYKMATTLYVNNTCFIVPVYDNDFRTIGYYPMIPASWEVKELNGEPWLVMHFHEEGRRDTTGALKLKEVGILTRYQYKSKYFGEDRSGLDETMKLIDLQRQAVAENVKNGATYRFYAKSLSVLKTEDLKKERQRFTEENLQSSQDNGGVLLFPRDYDDIKQIENKPYSIDADQQKLIKDNVYDFYGVSTEVIQNNATSDQLDAFFNGCIEWISIQAGEVLRNLIFTYKERSYGNEVLLLANRLQYMSANQRLELSKDLLDRGILSINEAREILNLSPIEDGDVYFIRGEYYTVGQKTQGENNGTEDNQNA